MTNQELMQLMTDMDLHEGGIENWVPDNAWLRVANAVEAREREACVKACEAEIFKVKPIYCVVAENCVKIIRARGKND
jgi:hypothetical protein